MPTVNASTRSNRARSPAAEKPGVCAELDGVPAMIALFTRYRGLRLLTPPGVFAPRSDVGMLMDAALPGIHGEVLDVCTGSGVAALLAAPRASSTTAVDASVSAVLAAKANAALNGRRVRVLHGDLFRPVADRRFDVILCNPPYLPVPESAPAPLGAPAWDGGHDGRRVLDRICEEAAEVLRPGGALFLVQSVLADYERTLSLLTHAGLDAVVAARHTGPLGPLARRHAGHLRAIGALPEQDEEIVVVCAMNTAARWRLGATHAASAAR
jgi:release factor glutamine methyltransferase